MKRRSRRRDKRGGGEVKREKVTAKPRLHTPVQREKWRCLLRGDEGSTAEDSHQEGTAQRLTCSDCRGQIVEGVAMANMWRRTEEK